MATITRFPSSNSVGTTGWTNPTNAYADDGVYATCAPAKSATVSSYYSGFDFSAIGDSDTLNSVTLYCKYHVDTQASVADIALRTYDNTTQIGTDLTNNTEPLTDTVYSLVIPPTLAQLKSSTFRIRASGHRGSSTTAVTLSLDCIYVVVDYTPAASGYTLTADNGSFTETGQAANLIVDRILAAETGSFAIAGIDANLTKAGVLNHYTLVCETGNISLIGNTATLKADRTLTAASGSYALTGQGATLKADRRMIAGAGSFAVAGQSSLLTVARRLVADVGNFIVTGINALLTTEIIPLSYTLSADTGNFSLNGQAAGLRAAHKLTAETGALELTGFEGIFNLARCRRCPTKLLIANPCEDEITIMAKHQIRVKARNKIHTIGRGD